MGGGVLGGTTGYFASPILERAQELTKRLRNLAYQYNQLLEQQQGNLEKSSFLKRADFDFSPQAIGLGSISGGLLGGTLGIPIGILYEALREGNENEKDYARALLKGMGIGALSGGILGGLHGYTNITPILKQKFEMKQKILNQMQEEIEKLRKELSKQKGKK